MLLATDPSMAWPLLGGVAAGAAVVLGAGRAGPGRWGTDPAGGSRRVLTLLFGSASAVVIMWKLSSARAEQIAVVLILAGASIAAAALLRRRAQGRTAAAVADRVVEATELLATELSVGLTPSQALRQAAEGWPELAPVLAAEHLGADVPEAWRELSTIPGAQDLRLVAAAWSASTQVGGGLAVAMSRVAGGLRAARASDRVVASELASARATARLVAALPVLALMMGSSPESRPWEFLLTEPIGLACLASGLAFGLAGLWWIETIATGVHR